MDEARRAALMRTLEPMHRQYDPAERMLPRFFLAGPVRQKSR